MGWDLYSRKNGSYFRATGGGWEQLRGVLELLGANTEKMACFNEGDYVPANVAASWALRIERGIETLEQVVIGDEEFSDGYPVFVVPQGRTRKELIKILREIYGVDKEALKKVEKLQTQPLDREMRNFIRSFARFCRRSKGFEQW